jgi:hypothetical protein
MAWQACCADAAPAPSEAKTEKQGKIKFHVSSRKKAH